MRKKDASKKEALFHATQQIVIHEGFATLSMSKIATIAKVAPATLYTYFKNTDELLDELFMTLHLQLIKAVSEDFSQYKSYEKWFRKIWRNLYKFLITHPEDFAFSQQFKTSPRMKRLCLKKKCEDPSLQMREVIKRGQKEGVLKNLPKEAMHAFVFSPVVELAQMKLAKIIQITPKVFQQLEDLAWELLSVHKNK